MAAIPRTGALTASGPITQQLAPAVLAAYGAASATAPAPTAPAEPVHNPLSRYPGAGSVGTVDQQLAAIAAGDGATAVGRNVYLGSVLAEQTGVDPYTAIAQVDAYKEQTGYYPDVGQSQYGLTPGQAAKIYGPTGAVGNAAYPQGATTQAGILSGFSLDNPLTLALLLGAGVLAFVLFGKKGKGGGHRGR